MLKLKKVLEEAQKNKVAIGHFNISDIVALKAIFESARALSNQLGKQVPVIIGTSEGEREFIGPRQAVALIKSLREEYEYPIFLNADHTHSFQKAKEALQTGYDAILFFFFFLPIEQNIYETKAVVEYVKNINKEVVVEGEIGYIGSSSEVLQALPEGAVINPKDLTTPEEAKRFIEKTGVDMLAPAVGNVHGIILPRGAAKAQDPPLVILRIKEIKNAVHIPLVLHGGSGNTPQDIKAAIEAGITILHISTELRLAWRRGMEGTLQGNPDEVAPYKLYAPALHEMQETVSRYLALCNKIKIS